jgi:hypothetical protein
MRQFSSCARMVRQLAQVRAETVFEPDYSREPSSKKKAPRARRRFEKNNQDADLIGYE